MYNTHDKPDTNQRLIKSRAAAHILGICPRTLRAWGEQGMVRPAFKSNGDTRYYNLELITKLADFNRQELAESLESLSAPERMLPPAVPKEPVKLDVTAFLGLRLD
jgi:MerR HTH family regulatory protein